MAARKTMKEQAAHRKAALQEKAAAQRSKAMEPEVSLQGDEEESTSRLGELTTGPTLTNHQLLLNEFLCCHNPALYQGFLILFVKSQKDSPMRASLHFYSACQVSQNTIESFLKNISIKVENVLFGSWENWDLGVLRHAHACQKPSDSES
jgi:hypothetical protein